MAHLSHFVPDGGSYHLDHYLGIKFGHKKKKSQHYSVSGVVSLVASLSLPTPTIT